MCSETVLNRNCIIIAIVYYNNLLIWELMMMCLEEVCNMCAKCNRRQGQTEQAHTTDSLLAADEPTLL